MSDLANSTNPEGTVFFTMAMGPKNMEAFAITAEGTLYHNFLTPQGTWGKWEADFLKAPKSVSLHLLMGPTGSLEAFLVGKEKKLYHSPRRPGAGQPGGGVQQPGKLVGDPGVGAFGNRR